MESALIREKQREIWATQRRREDRGKTEAETRVMQLQGMLMATTATGRGKERLSLEPLEGAWPCQCLDFGPLAPQTVREQVSVMLSPSL